MPGMRIPVDSAPVEVEAIAGIPMLSRLKESYLYGNRFSEEQSKDAPTVVKRPPTFFDRE